MICYNSSSTRYKRNFLDIYNILGAKWYTSLWETKKNWPQYLLFRYIEKRDGIGTVDSENVVMSTGASGAIVALLKMLVRGPGDGIMIPIPQYPPLLRLSR